MKTNIPWNHTIMELNCKRKEIINNDKLLDNYMTNDDYNVIIIINDNKIKS